MRKYCKYEKMGLEEYASKFRVQHPEVPEPYYGRLAKVKIASPDKNQTETEMTVSSAGVDTLDSRPTVPKLVLRRDSVQGATWEKVSSVTTAGEKSTAVPVTQLLTADPGTAARNEVTSMILNTGHAVTSMLNKLKATFKPVEGETVAAPDGRVENGIQLTEEATSKEARSSSAARGRG